MIVVYEKDYYDEVTGNAVFTADSKIESMRWRNKLADIMDECNDDILAYLSLRNMVIDEETKNGKVNHAIHALDTFFSGIESF